MKGLLAFLTVAMAIQGRAWAIDYVNDVLPIMKERCWKCHSNEEKVKGDLALDDLDEMRDYTIREFSLIRPGNPEDSDFLAKMKLPPGDNDFMPRKGDPLPKRELALIEEWIVKGAIGEAKNLSEKEKARLAGVELPPDEDERQKFHAWSNTEGTKIEARFLRLVEGAVDIVMKNGKSYRVPLDKLSGESRALAKRLAEKK